MSSLFEELTGLIGEDDALALFKRFSGQNIYFCKVETLTRPERDASIRAAWKGNNLKDLARQYNLSEQRIRDIVQESRPAADPTSKPQQQGNLLDWCGK